MDVAPFMRDRRGRVNRGPCRRRGNRLKEQMPNPTRQLYSRLRKSDSHAFSAVRRSPRLLENLPPDQHAADFAGPGADLVELGVTQQPAGGKIIDIAVAAKTLDGFERHPGGALGGVEN